MTVIGDTVAVGHPRTPDPVEYQVIPRYHSHSRAFLDPKPVRCLRHGVWMASCDDCRAAHTELVKAARRRAARTAR